MDSLFTSSRDVILRSDRFQEAVAFYGGVLGLRTTWRSASLVGFETGAFTLYVEDGAPHGPVFELLVADVAAARMRLLAEGCLLVEEDATVPRCYLRDPYGFIFNLRQTSGT